MPNKIFINVGTNKQIDVLVLGRVRMRVNEFVKTQYIFHLDNHILLGIAWMAKIQ